MGEGDAPPPPRPHGRLDKEHPDRKGEQLRKWAPVFKAFAKEAEKKGGKVGVFIDYTALPQRSLASHAPGAEDDRTPEELATFKRAPSWLQSGRGPGCSQRPGGWPQCAQPHTPGVSEIPRVSERDVLPRFGPTGALAGMVRAAQASYTLVLRLWPSLSLSPNAICVKS